MTRGEVEAVGPTGLVGRPALAANRPQLLGVGLVWASLSDPRWGWSVLTRFASVLGLLWSI